MRLIDADALKKELEVWVVAINHPQFYNREEALYIIDSAPTADAVPVVRGEWMLNEDGKWACSSCDGLAIEHPDKLDKRQAITAYCPNCGAKMDEKEENE